MSKPLELRSRLLSYRFGLKGPGAAGWLQANGMPIPAVPNTWAARDSMLVARLGGSEFFLEEAEGGGRLRSIDPGIAGASAAHARSLAGVYPVLRQDAAFVLSGSASPQVLAEVCNVNFSELALEGNPLVMTLMVGVAVLVIPEMIDGERQFKIWCDPSYGAYVAESLRTVLTDSLDQST